MSDSWWRKLSRDTLALILANEYLLEHQPLPELKAMLATFATNPLDQVALLELVIHKARLMGMSPGQIINLHAGLSPDLGATHSTLETQAIPHDQAAILRAQGAAASTGLGGSVQTGNLLAQTGRSVGASAAPTTLSSSSAPDDAGAFRVKVPVAPPTAGGGRKIVPPAANAFAEPAAPPPSLGPVGGGRERGGRGAVFNPLMQTPGTLSNSVRQMAFRRVLIADDDRRIRMIFHKKLEEAHCIVDEAATGEEAWTMLQENVYGALVMDMKMPGLHGLELLSRLSAEGGKLPVVVCSAYDQLKDDFVIATYPKIKFFVKPVSPNDVTDAVLAFLPEQAS